MTRYELKETNTRRRNILLGVGLMVLLVCMLAIYYFAYHKGNRDFSSYNERIESLNTQIKLLKQQNTSLSKQNALVKSSDKFERSELVSLKAEVGRLEAELVKNRKDLLFYKSLLEPEREIFGLYVHSAKLTSTGDGSYAYTVVLAQAKQSSPQVQGKVKVSVLGQDGKPLIQGSDVNFKFKFFQRFDGTVNIRKNQRPSAILVEVKPRSNRLKSVKQSYPWGTLLGE